MKRFFYVLKTTLVWLVMLLAVCMTVFTIISLRTVNAKDRNFFGYKAFIVQSDSMSKTDFSAGDIIFVKETDPRTLRAGDIIAFISENSHNRGDTVTHKIREVIALSDGTPAFITYGTTTDTDDEAAVTYDHVLGVYTGRVPQIGVFFTYLRTPKGYISLILIPFLLMIGYSFFNVIRLSRLSHQEEKQEQQRLLDAQRKENEDLRKELEALKAMVTGSNGMPPMKKAPPTAVNKHVPQPKETQTIQQKPYDELDLENIVREFSPTLHPKPNKKK